MIVALIIARSIITYQDDELKITTSEPKRNLSFRRQCACKCILREFSRIQVSTKETYKRKKAYEKDLLGETMPTCPKCGTLLDEDSVFCSKCGSALPQQLTASSSIRERELHRIEIAREPQSTSPPSYPPARDMTRSYVTFGILSAIVSLFIMPEIFGLAATVLGAYAWKNDRSDSNRGLFVVVLGIICLIVGIEITAPIWLGGFLPS
jgi:ribosomal protein S27AE